MHGRSDGAVGLYVLAAVPAYPGLKCSLNYRLRVVNGLNCRLLLGDTCSLSRLGSVLDKWKRFLR